MQKHEALDLLNSNSAVDRLRAARVLRKLAMTSDRDVIEATYAAEADAWIRSALSKILSPSPQLDTSSIVVDTAVEDAQQLVNDVRSQTTQELTAMVTHELGPLVGSLRMACISEVRNYDESESRRAVAGIDSFLNAIQGLHLASGVPSISDFSLSDTVLESIKTVQDERLLQPSATKISVKAARTDHVTAAGDRDLIRMALVNVVRNALEASDPLGEENGSPVVVNWGVTDRDAWISVFDRGVGLPAGASRMLEAGVTSKNKDFHSGMGLAVCVRALQGMNGTLRHKPREGGGVVAEIRWRGAKVADACTSS